MVRLQTYAAFSLLAAVTAVCYAFRTRRQFYPAMVYLSASKICFTLLVNVGLVAMCAAWQLVKRLFLGSLREVEVERLNEQAWREVVDILFAVTIFRQDFSVGFVAAVVALLLIKALHWLAAKRVEYIETTPSVPVLAHARIASFMVFLLVVDCLLLSSAVSSLLSKREASVAIFFAFEYMILVTTTVSTFVKYVFYVSDMLMDGQWEKKAVYTFYLELISDLLHLSLYMLFFIAIFLNYGIPLHLIRELYETFRNFRVRISDYVRYRRLTSNMNERFPDAASEELSSNDATCIICREEMTSAKKLNCGHLFHVHCLRSWLERQHTCPTCRAAIVPPESGSAPLARQHGAPAETSNHGAHNQEHVSSGENLSRRQAKLQAAASAASLYEKSFVYPPSNSASSFSAHPFQPLVRIPATEASGGLRRSVEEGSSSSQSQQYQVLQNMQSQVIQLTNQIEFLKAQLEQQQKAAAALASTNYAVPRADSVVAAYTGESSSSS